MNFSYRFARFTLLLASISMLALADNNGNGNGNDDSNSQGDDKPIKHELNPQKLGGAPTAGSTGVVTPKITSHGGPVMSTPVIYYIWYGNWNQTNGTDNPAGQAILVNLAQNIGGPLISQINQTYGATGLATYGGAVTDSYSQGTSLTDAKIKTGSRSAISSHNLLLQHQRRRTLS